MSQVKKILATCLVTIALGGLAGCSHFSKKHDKFDGATSAEAAQASGQTLAQAQGAAADPLIEDRDSDGRPIAMGTGAGNDGYSESGSSAGDRGHSEHADKNTFYFKFDNSTVAEEDYETIRAQAKHLANNPDARIRLDGHTDERGSREYNLALGERRAKSVEELLKLHGASSNQIDVITHGKEKPVAVGHNEESWRLNRRVELKANTY